LGSMSYVEADANSVLSVPRGRRYNVLGSCQGVGAAESGRVAAGGRVDQEAAKDTVPKGNDPRNVEG